MDRRAFFKGGSLLALTIAGVIQPPPRPRPTPGYYQDAAGTIPATCDGDPVALYVPRFGPSFVQRTASKRPMLRGGVALFDGIDDVLDLSNLA